MTSHRSLVGFLARLPAILAVISRGIARAIWQLLERVCTAAWNALSAICNLIAEATKWLWTTYCKIEFSVVQVFVSLVLSIWSLRLLVVLVAIALVLGYFNHWKSLAIYVVALTVAVLLYFRMSPEDEVRAIEAQRPLRDWLTSVLRWVLRIVIALASGSIFLVSGSFGASTIWKEITTMHKTEQHAVSKEAATIEGGHTSPLNLPPRPTQVVRTPPIIIPPAQQISTSVLPTLAVAEVARTVEDSILRVLAAAQTESRGVIENAAKQAGRSFDFSVHRVERNRKEARRLNEAATHAFQSDRNPASAYELQKQALTADPLDVEIAGNMATYAFLVGQFEEARLLSLYALALPRGPEKTGRTADWSTLAAVYAQRGDALQARNALFVTLAIAADVAKRCKSAVYSVKNMYGDVLKEATSSMFERISAEALSDSPECALPIQW